MWRDGAVSGSGWLRRKPTRKRGLVLTGTSAALVLAVGVVFATVAAPGSHASLVASEGPAHATKPLAPAASMQLVSMTPAAGAKNVNGTSPIRVQFSTPLAPDSPMPTLSPSIPGSWAVQGNAAVFTPKVGYFENTKVTVKIPGGLAGMVSAAGATAGNGGTMGSNATQSFTTRSFSTMRLQQLMTQLGYLPMTWKSTSGATVSPTGAKAQLAAAYSAPAGKFSWKGSWPWTLRSQWKAGKYNILNVGAVRAFESVNGMTMDGSAGKSVWTKLLKQVAKGQQNPNGYTYALANQHYPINLTIWHNGKEVLHSLANTGIPASSTVDGTFPVYLKYVFSHMKGTNPDGSKYDDPVWYASYFNGGDAVHQFDRYSYGSYQSLGCVEVPYSVAKKAYPYLTYGSLVTVEGPVA
jgi:peptidoglycan hydrolase-like protein with peptidoglycan-binding domain